MTDTDTTQTTRRIVLRTLGAIFGGATTLGTVQAQPSTDPGELTVEISAVSASVGGEPLTVTAMAGQTGGGNRDYHVTAELLARDGGMEPVVVDETEAYVHPEQAEPIELSHETYPVRQDVSYPIWVRVADPETDDVAYDHRRVTVPGNQFGAHGGGR